ncbi:MAG: mechanosensitive ion channel family protein [Thermoleophilaceae bacterium]
MTAPDAITIASFVSDYKAEITAVMTVVLALALARAIDHALDRRAHRTVQAVAGRQLSAVADTRLRLVRRLIFAIIIVIGIALALAQFGTIRRLATGVLASSALLGLVVGFAARQTLANAIAGIMLVISQPIRIGDLVTFEEETGEVEDVRLTYTHIRCPDGRRLIVPNERLAQTAIENHTLVDPRIQVEIWVWIPPDADATLAAELLAGPEGVEASVAESDRDATKLSVTVWAASAGERAGVAARLRKESLHRLREAGLSSKVPG